MTSTGQRHYPYVTALGGPWIGVFCRSGACLRGSYAPTVLALVHAPGELDAATTIAERHSKASRDAVRGEGL
jgi:hypothetical protein